MDIAIFIIYLALCSFFLTRIRFIKIAGLRNRTVIALFLIKITAGIGYAQFYKIPKYYQGSDTWRFFRLSVEETKWLKENPLAFIKDLFVFGYSKAGNVFSGENTYWNDLKSNVPIKLLALMNLITNNNYYTNLILFNFIFFFGLIALFKVFNDLFPGKKLNIIIGLFLLPSTLFWCSGIHKDGLILSATGILIYIIYFSLKNTFKVKYIAPLLISAVLIFSLRNYVLFALIIGIFCWVHVEKNNRKPLKTFGFIYLIGVIIFFTIPLLVPALNFPAYLANKQMEFLKLEAGSIAINSSLQPSLSSFVSFFPAAIDMAFLRPHPNEMRNLSYLPAAAEVILLFALILFCLVQAYRNRANYNKAFLIFCLFFAFSILLICGYTIPFTGAIVRYRSFSFPFLITPLLCSVNTRTKLNSNFL